MSKVTRLVNEEREKRRRMVENTGKNLNGVFVGHKKTILEYISEMDEMNKIAGGVDEATKAHYFAFMKWKDNQDINIYDDPDVYINLDNNKLMSRDDLYQLWLEIKDK